MNEKKRVIRTYREGDEHHILHLYRLVFGKDRSLSHWKWKFKDNPYSTVIAALAYTCPEGEIIAQHTVLPLQIAFLGEPVLAGQELDTMTHPDFRRRGISIETAQKCYAEFKTNGTCLVYGFPNENAYPALIRRLGWKRIVYLKEYSFLLDAYQILKPLLRYSLLSRIIGFFYNLWVRVRLSANLIIIRNRLPKSLTLCHGNRVPEGYEQLWDSIRKYEVLCVWKDAEYVKWRYDNNPDHKFEYLYLVEDGEIVALSVINTNRANVGLICELLVKSRNVSRARFLITEVLLYLRRRKVREALFIGSDGGFIDEVLVGFRPARLFGIPFCVRICEATSEMEHHVMQASNWTITAGDIDVV